GVERTRLSGRGLPGDVDGVRVPEPSGHERQGSLVPNIVIFAREARGKFGFAAGRVLEVGSMDINGSIRPAFGDASEYIGIDLTPGPGVDRVMSAHDLDQAWPAGWFDTVVCCEMLEHDPMPWKTVPLLQR